MNNWNDAYAWKEAANKDKDPDYAEPNWSWDCGFKLDFDGGLLRTESRFYQVRDNIFSGRLTFRIGDSEICDREFSGRHLDVLKSDVERYTEGVTKRIKHLLGKNLHVFVPPIDEDK